MKKQIIIAASAILISACDQAEKAIETSTEEISATTSAVVANSEQLIDKVVATNTATDETNGSLLGALKNAAGSLKDKTDEAWSVSKEAVGEASDSVVDGAKELSSSALEKGQSVVAEVSDKTQEVVEEAKVLGQSVLNKGKDASAEVIEQVKEVSDSAKTTIDEVAELSQEAGDAAVQSTQEAANDIQTKGAEIINKAKKTLEITTESAATEGSSIAVVTAPNSSEPTPTATNDHADTRLTKVALSELVGQLETALASMEAAAREARVAAKALNQQVWNEQ